MRRGEGEGSRITEGFGAGAKKMSSEHTDSPGDQSIGNNLRLAQCGYSKKRLSGPIDPFHASFAVSGNMTNFLRALTGLVSYRLYRVLIRACRLSWAELSCM